LVEVGCHVGHGMASRGAMTHPLRVLHTADWHLGRSLCHHPRLQESQAFLSWLLDTLHDHAVDVLLVAGDVFDTTTPSPQAQSLYYQFLAQVALSPCRHVVIIAGNHDSPTLLDAPQSLLQALNIHVVGTPSASPDDEVILLSSNHGVPELLVCAVPYLRDRDIRAVEPGEAIEDKDIKRLAGIHQHYQAVAHVARQQQAALHSPVPIIGMGHLFAAGGHTVEGDGVRDLYVGSLAHVPATLFPTCFEYVALGHLHAPQSVAGNPCIRYAGSPFPMGFSDANSPKSVCLIDLTAPTLSVTTLPIPISRRLASVTGDWAAITTRLSELAHHTGPCWVEVIYQGDEWIGDLHERLVALTHATSLDIVRVKNMATHMSPAMTPTHPLPDISTMGPDEVFQQCLQAHHIPESEWPGLWYTYHEALASLSSQP